MSEEIEVRAHAEKWVTACLKSIGLYLVPRVETSTLDAASRTWTVFVAIPGGKDHAEQIGHAVALGALIDSPMGKRRTWIDAATGFKGLRGGDIFGVQVNIEAEPAVRQ